MSVTNIPWTAVTFSYTPVDGSAVQTISFNAPDFGNLDSRSNNQDYQQTRGGQAYVYQRGVQIRAFAFHWPNLNATERAAVEDFFERNTLYALRWFTVSWAPTQPELLNCGGLIGGVAIASGAGYYCGQRVIQDTVQFQVRLQTPDLIWNESVYDGLWDLSLVLEQVSVLPKNA